MWIPIAVLVVGLILTVAAVVAGDGYDWAFQAVIGVVATAIATLIVAVAVDGYYERNSFSARVACESQRMQAKRQSFSANVACVPAYRETKSDTTTINLNTKP
jgi:hypothetical protein